MTLNDIKTDILANGTSATALYFATEEQINKLISTGKIDEDYSYYADQCREEMRSMILDSIDSM